MRTIKILIVLISFLAISSCKAEPNKNLALTTNPTSQITPFTPKPPSKHYIKVALLLDTSNSMDGLIDQAKAQLWEIVNELSYAKCKGQNPNLQIALFEYGNDNLSNRSGYIRKILGFTGDLDDVSKELFSLTTNGGNEYCGAVIQKSLDKLDWGNDPDDLKMIFIAGNEPFTQGHINYLDATTHAVEKNVVVNTIFCGDYSQGVSGMWKDGAERTQGDYMSINHNKKTIYVATPYDDQILQLNIQLNNTYVAYGRDGRKKIENQRAQDENSMGYSKGNAVSRTITKSGRLYNNSSWDLVDAEAEEDFDYSKLKQKDLPEELQGKTKKEIQNYIAQQRKKREEIKAKIAMLNKKRQEYIRTNHSQTENELESAMLKAIKKQALKRNYTWEK